MFARPERCAMLARKPFFESNRREVPVSHQPTYPYSPDNVWGIGAIIRNRLFDIVLVQEAVSKPRWGKYAGMWSLPMETIEPHERIDFERGAVEQILVRLVHEEVPWLEGFVRYPAEYFGEYPIAENVRAKIYVLWSDRVSAPREPVINEEIGNAILTCPRHAYATLWLRQGVPEMLRDYTDGYTNMRRQSFQLASAAPTLRISEPV